MSLNGQSVSGGYDALGRQVTETGALGTVRYQYDAAGRRTQLTYPDGFYVTYGYDAASELTTIKDNTGFTLATYAWDNYGRRGSLTLGNGAQTVYTYDNSSNLALLNVNLPSGQNQAISLGYNPAGQIKSRSASNDAYAYTGAAASSNAYTLNGRNQIAVSGPSTFSYDGRGNLTNDGVNTYAYDIANRLTTVGSVSLSYDPLSRLAKTAGSATTQFAYDGSEIIAEYNSAGAEQSRYVRGPGNDQPIVWYNVAGGTRYWLQANPQGSIIAVTGDNGAAAAINTYDDYGLPGSGNLGRFQYTGQAWIPEIRMYHYKARIYSPNLGRFLQSDPIGYGDGMNFYNYTHGDPVNRRDPTGTWGCPAGTYDDGYGACVRMLKPVYVQGDDDEPTQGYGPGSQDVAPDGPGNPAIDAYGESGFESGIINLTPGGAGTFVENGTSPQNMCQYVAGDKQLGAIGRDMNYAGMGVQFAGGGVTALGLATAQPEIIGGGAATAGVGKIMSVGGQGYQLLSGLMVAKDTGDLGLAVDTIVSSGFSVASAWAKYTGLPTQPISFLSFVFPKFSNGGNC